MQRELLDQVYELAELALPPCFVWRQIVELVANKLGQAPVDQDAQVMGFRV